MNIFGKLISDLRGDNIVVNRDDFFKYLLFELTKHEGLDFCLFPCLIGVPQLVQKSEPSSNLEPQFEQ